MGQKSKNSPSRRPKTKFKGTPSWRNPKLQQPVVPREDAISQASEDAEESQPQELHLGSSDADKGNRSVPEKSTMETPKSASARKIGTEYTSSFDDESNGSLHPHRNSASKSPYFQEPEPEGNVIVSLKNLREAMELMHKCKGGHIKLVDDYSKRHGLCNSLYFECTCCKHRVYLESSQKSGHVSDINRRAAFAMSEVGLGREGLAVICEIMNLPPPLSDSNFQTHNNAVHEATTKVVNTKMEEAACELRQKLLSQNPGLNDDSILDITVSFDGTWSKRGFTANYGVGFVIAAETGKVIDFVTLSKNCEICKQGNKLKGDKEKFETWKREHESSGKCPKKFTGTSSAMEKHAAKVLWGRSIDKYGFRYTNMVCDGDSKSHTEVWDIYGVCDLCAKYERMGKKSPDYQKWIKSKEFESWVTDHDLEDTGCKRVNKLDCIGHVQKRMGKNLLNLTKEKKLKDGKTVGGRAGRLTRAAIDKLQRYYGNAIRRNVDRKAKTRVDVDRVVKGMQTSITAVLYHSTKITDDDKRHQYCPKGPDSWCLYQKDLVSESNTKTFETKEHHLDPVFLEFLTPTFNRLSEPQLLKRCVPGYSQNANGMTWNRCPKHRQKGYVSVDTAAGSATLAFNGGAQNRHEVMEKLKIPPGKATKAGSVRKDKKRVMQSTRRLEQKYQDYRAKMRNAQKRLDKKYGDAEGTTYLRAGFNEDILAEPAENTSKRKRR